MAGIQKAKSEETQRRVLEAAVAAVEAGGLEAIHIRKIAAQAGYSVGSIYKHYEDQDALILAVSSVTLGRIKTVMAEAVEGIEEPLARLKSLAQSYLTFARDNRNLLTALFAFQISEGKQTPDWHIQENIALLGFIAGPLRELDPDLDDEALAARTRTCFAAVHGLVTISLEERFIGLYGDRLEKEMDFLVERLAG
ncbi:TetR/AcrR family transcriptional regulator [Roseibium aggregatum]|uniref:TetR/AcrR family transcriptional regulator n=1 Tax=Roseibium aggregatum TaxID=187304 RepID=A0A939EE43_9HYPH|nr:TetR/AcrR family transcriptional regulator [Roseibium aggregatum]MBN9670867.1 TetR/AcrR family transcriptional regulator [Roseibium aggregatum]